MMGRVADKLIRRAANSHAQLRGRQRGRRLVHDACYASRWITTYLAVIPVEACSHAPSASTSRSSGAQSFVRWTPQHRSTEQHPGTAHSTENVAAVAEVLLRLGGNPLGGIIPPGPAPHCSHVHTHLPRERVGLLEPSLLSGAWRGRRPSVSAKERSQKVCGLSPRHGKKYHSDSTGCWISV